MGKSSNDYDAWMRVFVAISDAAHCSSGIRCPNCGEATIDFQYVGYPETRLGYLQVWCSACLQGISFSRVKAPPHVDILAIDGPPDVITKRIPPIDEVSPA